MSFAMPVNGSFLKRAAWRMPVLFAAVIALSAFAAPSPSQAASASPAAPATFASVDLAKVYAGSKIKTDNDATLQTMGARYDSALKTLQTNVMLSADDLTHLAGLLVTEVPTDDETKQIATLEAKAKADGDALSALQQKADKDLTDDDKAKMASLSSEYQAGQQALQTVQQTFQDKMQQENDKLNNDAAAKIHAAVAKVALKQNITIVFSSQFAVYAATDITDQVSTEMSK